MSSILAGPLLLVGLVEAFLVALGTDSGDVRLPDLAVFWWLLPLSTVLITAVGCTAVTFSMRDIGKTSSAAAAGFAWLGLVPAIQVALFHATSISLANGVIDSVLCVLVASPLLGIALVRAGRRYGWLLIVGILLYGVPAIVGWWATGIDLIRRPDAPFAQLPPRQATDDRADRR